MAGTPSNVVLGPGKISVAPIGTTEPATRTAALDVAFRDVGYTSGGNTFTYTLTNEAITVDQELDPVKYVTTGRAGGITFTMAEATVQNLLLALNGGAAGTNTALEPPAAGAELRVIIVFDADNGARWIFRQCFQAGTVTVAHVKAPGITGIPVDFRLEVPNGAKSFKVYPATDGTI